jgi:NADPH:quinone reductase-like Zn-dependent oxidoreductase
MRSMATNMTAVHQSAYGLDAIGIREKPAPSAGPEQVRIKVTASTVNPMDWHLAMGAALAKWGCVAARQLAQRLTNSRRVKR